MGQNTTAHEGLAKIGARQSIDRPRLEVVVYKGCHDKVMAGRTHLVAPDSSTGGSDQQRCTMGWTYITAWTDRQKGVAYYATDDAWTKRMFRRSTQGWDGAGGEAHFNVERLERLALQCSTQTRD